MERFRQLNTMVNLAHADDETMGAGTIRELHDQKSPLQAAVYTDNNADGLRERRHREMIESARVLGIGPTHFVGEQFRIKDTLKEPNINAAQRTAGRMFLAGMHVFSEAKRRGWEVQRVIAMDEEGVTGHEQHKAVHDISLRLSAIFDSVQELWVISMSPEQRAAFLDSYNGKYATEVPEVDTSRHKRIEIYRTLPYKLASIDAHESQKADGERLKARTLAEDPPVEHVRILPREEFIELAKAA